MSKFDPTKFDLAKLSKADLHTMYENNKKAGRTDVVSLIINEAKRRNLRTGYIVGDMPWTQSKVREALLPFKRISETVIGNKRTVYTEAGGLKIGRSIGDFDKHYIESYSRIQTKEIDAIFFCLVKELDSDAVFKLSVNKEDKQFYNAEQLDKAEVDWKAIAKIANK
ncbi:MAG: hypothetical protein ACRCTD_04865 [Beijerinckiaceae bacterium]